MLANRILRTIATKCTLWHVRMAYSSYVRLVQSTQFSDKEAEWVEKRSWLLENACWPYYQAIITNGKFHKVKVLTKYFGSDA